MGEDLGYFGRCDLFGYHVLSSNWLTLSKAVVRYLDHQLKDKIQTYKELRETKSAFIKDFSKVVYEQFDQNYTVWLKAVRCVAEIDALASLAKASAYLGGLLEKAAWRWTWYTNNIFYRIMSTGDTWPGGEHGAIWAIAPSMRHYRVS